MIADSDAFGRAKKRKGTPMPRVSPDSVLAADVRLTNFSRNSRQNVGTEMDDVALVLNAGVPVDDDAIEYYSKKRRRDLSELHLKNSASHAHAKHQTWLTKMGSKVFRGNSAPNTSNIK